MAHIIITGATGSAGAAVLTHALESPIISRVSVLSRRPVKLAEGQAKADVIIHSDFETYPEEVLSRLQGATGCVWAQGISSRGMNEDEYIKITVDYPLAAARAFSTLGPKMNFVYVSGEGADMEKQQGGMMYARVKGAAERKLLELQAELEPLHVYNIRPGVINPAGKYLAERKPSLLDKSSTFIGNILGWVYPSGVITTNDFAKACVRLATGDGEPIPAGAGVMANGRLLRNHALRRLSTADS